MKSYLTALTAALALIAIIVVPGCRQPSQPVAADRAAIIDQLYLLEPDPAFIDDATRMLRNAGFEVDLWQGEEITMDFYAGTPAAGLQAYHFQGTLRSPAFDGGRRGRDAGDYLPVYRRDVKYGQICHRAVDR